MARNDFNGVSFLLRWLFAAVLVFGTFNPTDYCYAHWAFSDIDTFGPVTALVGVALLIGWIIFLRATFISMGWLGIALGAAFFGCIIWLLVDIGWISLENTNAMMWIVLLLVSLILATGMSWSHIRRRMTGQYDVDDVDD
jgi:hypothetical protein